MFSMTLVTFTKDHFLSGAHVCVYIYGWSVCSLLYFYFVFLILTLSSSRQCWQTLLTQSGVGNFKVKYTTTQKQPRWHGCEWFSFFFSLVQGLRCLLENQHSSGILGRCTAMWVPGLMKDADTSSCVPIWCKVLIHKCMGMILIPRWCFCVSLFF